MRKKLRNYRITGAVASSLGAVVYKAEQEPLARPVSLKVLHEELGTNADMVQRFEREARICANLEHPNIVRIFEYGRWRGEYFIAQEWVEGISLEELLERGPVPVNFGMYILREMASGLAYAHEQGIIHRDVKPGNVLLGFDGSVKLADFGVARSVSLPDLTVEGTLIGTPAYSAPEQIRCGKVDIRADIFSLGVVAYEIFSGFNPFSADSYTQIIERITRTRPRALATLNPSVPLRISKAIQKMIAKTPSGRLGDMRQLLKILDGSRGSRNIIATPSELAQYLKGPRVAEEFVDGRRKGKLPMWVYPVCAGLALLIALGIVFSGSLFSGRKKTENIPILDTVADLESENQDTVNSAVARVGIPMTESAGHVEAANSSFLRFRASPWARVYVDGEYFETTPTQRVLSIDPGRHKITFSHDYLPSRELVVIPGPGETLTVSADLEKDVSWLALSVRPWGEVYIDGVHVGTTPFAAPLALKPGSHLLRVVHPSSPPFEASVVVGIGDTLKKNVTFEAGS